MKAGEMAESRLIKHRSGFCPSDCIFYSKRKPVALPMEEYLDVATFVSSLPHSGDVALIDATTGEKVTYPRLWSMVRSLAAGLSSLGVRRGDVVLLVSPNSVRFPVVCLAVLSLGAVLTAANPLNTTQEIRQQASDSRPVLAFTTPDFLPKLASLGLPIVLMGDYSLGGGRLDVKVPATMQQLVEAWPTPTEGLRDAVRQGDTATLLYSSGTTGRSKGVASSHQSLIATVIMVMQRFRLSEGAQTFLGRVPMFHVYGLTVLGLGALASGSTVVVVSEPGLESIATAIERYGVTYFPLAPPLVAALAKSPTLDLYDMSSLQTVLCGGAPLSQDVVQEFEARFPQVALLQGYAMTETTGMGSSTDTVEESKRIGSSGLLSPNMEAKIVDPETGRALAENGRGELWLRGPCIMKGYHSNPEATKLILDEEGWLKTGDLCYIDDDGYLFVVDRLKELIKYKGFQVPPAELEALLLAHPQIIDAAVVPFPDEIAGQIPLAYVVRREGTDVLLEDEVITFIAKKVAPYKKVRKVSFVGSIPRTPSGKILRKDLIKIATSCL
ncbi:4-coumarate--CoA ligase-like 5 [Nymphaea thermarum]|nr:4-coumarate--CoA ligase-like 5 [Nymphaea thermarum]